MLISENGDKDTYRNVKFQEKDRLVLNEDGQWRKPLVDKGVNLS